MYPTFTLLGEGAKIDGGLVSRPGLFKGWRRKERHVQSYHIQSGARKEDLITAMTKDEPDYPFLYGLARKGLRSSEIDFAVREDNHVTTGRVIVGGFGPSEDFVIEKGVSPDEAMLS
jgi:hypothetical protein